jgi:hypothetical protein
MRENLTSQEILCQNSYFFNNFAKCQLRDDLSDNLQKVFMLIFCINIFLLGKNVLNIVMVAKLSKIKRVTDMKAFNYALLPLIITQLILYSNSFIESYGNTGYSLSVYQSLAVFQVLLLNSIMAYGAYLWMMMIFNMSFNNEKKKLVKFFFVVSILLNSIFCLYLGFTPFIFGLDDTTWWPDFQLTAQITMILVTLSTLINGVFFSVGSFYASSFLKTSQTIKVANKQLVCDLMLLAGIFSLIRVAQDFIQSFWPFVMTIKQNSVVLNDWSYPIYIFLYIVIANLIPTGIFLQRYSPSILSNQNFEESSAAIFNDNHHDM